MKKLSNSIFFFVTILLLVACRPVVLDAIAEECLQAESANLKVNDSLQIPKTGSIGGAPLYYLFGAKPNGEWSVNIESENYELAVMVSELLPIETFVEMSDKAQHVFITENGKYNLLERTDLLKNFLFQDFKRNILLEAKNLVRAEVKIDLQRSATCNFVVVGYLFVLKNDVTEWKLEGAVQSAFAKNINNKSDDKNWR